MGRTATNIQLFDAYCRSATLYMSIKNIGTTSIANTPTFVVKGNTITNGITCSPSFPLAAGASTMCSNSTFMTPNSLVVGPNEIRIIGPSNAVGGTVNC
jgi:hypothetical protein